MDGKWRTMGELSARRRAVILAACCASVLLVGIDMTAVNVALPSIGRDFGTGTGGLSWTVDAYTLTLAALLMLSASTADRVGRRRVFLTGLAVFVASSALCALAPGLGWLIGFRVLQAVGGSMMNPVAMAILSNAFPDSAARARAIGVWAGVTGLALAIGPVVGGALVGSGLGWRWIFVINVPIGLAAIAVTARAVPESKAARPRRPDPVGQLLVIVALVALTYAIIEGGRAGWAAPMVIGAFCLSAAALAGILGYERRRAEPMLQLEFFRSVPFSGANLIAILGFAALSAFLFLNSLYLQQARHLSPLYAGLMIIPLAAVSLVYGPVNGRILARYGARPCLVVAGIAYLAAGLMLTRIDDSTATWWLLAAYAFMGLGNAAVGAPITHTAVAGMPPAQAGLAAGVSSATRQIGATLGVAIASVAIASVTGTSYRGLAAATHAAWWVGAGYGAAILLLGLVITTRWAAGTTLAAKNPSPSEPARASVSA
jgi:EmrB/QacA subfamily drug resistance transporter